MSSKLAIEKSAESMLSISNNLCVAACIAPLSYFIDVTTLSSFEQWSIRLAPIIIAGTGLFLRYEALRTFKKLEALG